MFGDVVAWFYKALAGINPEPNAPGFKRFIIKPNVVGDLTWARASYDSIRGHISSDWKHVNNKFELTATIPANTSANVYLPVTNIGSITESGKTVQKQKGIQFMGVEKGLALFEVQSGTYHFACSLSR
jgi:alpha-L-rhamnosidase